MERHIKPSIGIIECIQSLLDQIGEKNPNIDEKKQKLQQAQNELQNKTDKPINERSYLSTYLILSPWDILNYLKTPLAKIRQEIEETTNNYNELDDKNSKLKANIAKYRQMAKLSKQQLELEKSSKGIVAQDNSNHIEEVEKLKKKIKKLKEEKNNLNSLLQKQQQQIIDLETLNANNSNTNNLLEIEKITNEHKTIIDEKELLIDRYKTGISSLHNEISDFQRKLGEIKQNHETEIKKIKQNHETEIIRLKNDHEEILRTEIKIYDDKLKEKENNNTILTDKVRQLTVENEELKTAKKNLSLDIKNLQTSEDKLLQENTRIKTTINKLTHEAKELNNFKIKASNDVKQLKIVEIKLKNDNEKLAQENDILKSTNEKLAQEKNNLKSENEKLAKDHENLKSNFKNQLAISQVLVQQYLDADTTSINLPNNSLMTHHHQNIEPERPPPHTRNNHQHHYQQPPPQIHEKDPRRQRATQNHSPLNFKPAARARYPPGIPPRARRYN